MPLFVVTVVAGGPVTSKWILPVDCVPWGMVAPVHCTPPRRFQALLSKPNGLAEPGSPRSR